MPEFSVIVPVYNVEKYIGRCIKSILEQKFADFELILVDDGSTDTSGQICDQYALQDKRIYVLHQENGGVSSARNAGLQRAQGEFISFLDSDDTVESNYLSCMAEVDSDVDLVVCGVKNVFPTGECSIKLYYNNKLIGCIKKEFILDAIENRAIDFVYAKRYKRRLIEKNKIYFDEQMNLGEDTCFVVNYLCGSNSIKYVTETPYRYHNYEQNTLSTFEQNYVNKLLSMNEKIAKVLEKRYGEIINTEVWKKRIFSIYHYGIFEILNNNRYSNKTKYRLLKQIVCGKEFKLFMPELDVYMGQESKVVRKIVSTGNPWMIMFFWRLISFKNILI